jgi:hypothetical protein
MIQDKQNPYPAGFTVGMSITLMDRISGPFQVSFAFYLPTYCNLQKYRYGCEKSSVADPDLGSGAGALLNPGSGSRKSFSLILDLHPIFLCQLNQMFSVPVQELVLLDPGSRRGKNQDPG